jgi:hypothetical protein
MANVMRYRFDGELYELAVCLNPEQIAKVSAGHADGVIDVERMMRAPNPDNGSTQLQRDWTMQQILKLRAKRDAAPTVPQPQTLSRIVPDDANAEDFEVSDDDANNGS